ncbi:hypothetical protein BD770DRAFT_431316 [Pilaira anomala]|nr:hypothetical protein BD770DRAFT_431316 [Pilaira anomala]
MRDTYQRGKTGGSGVLRTLVLGIKCDDFAGQKFWVVWACILRFVVIVTTSLSVKHGPMMMNMLVSYKLGFGSGEKEARTLDRCALFYNQNSLLVGTGTENK